jgi:hypothetical protein
VNKVKLIAWFVFFFAALAAFEAIPDRPRGLAIEEPGSVQRQRFTTPNMKVQFWQNGDLYATRGLSVFRSLDMGLTWEEVASLGTNGSNFAERTRRWIAGSKIVSRFRTNFGINRVMLLSNGTLLVAYGGIYGGKLIDGKVVYLEKRFGWNHGGPYFQGWTEDNLRNVFVGQYLVEKPSKRHNSVKLYCSRDHGESWSVCQEFTRSEMRHIHSVSYDGYRDLVWITSGDSNQESKILYSSDQGRSFTILGNRSQDWRAVSLQFDSEHIYWGSDNNTDTPGRQNYVFRWNWISGKKETLLTVRNPFYYSTQDIDAGKLYFSTAAEKIDEAYPSSRNSEIWELSLDGTPPRRLLSWSKGKLIMHGKIQFAQGQPPSGWLAFTPINLKGHHHETVVMKLTE